MKKVLVVFPYRYQKGIHPWSENQIEALGESGVEVEVVNLPRGKSKVFNFFSLTRCLASLFFKIPSQDIIYVSANYLLSFVTFQAKVFGKKVVISHILSTAKESERLKAQNFLKRILDFLDKRAYRLADLVITDSVSTNEGIIKAFGLEKEKVRAIYSCLDLELFSPEQKYQKFAENLKRKLGIQNKDILFYHGYFHAWHGLKYFLKVVPALLKVNPNFAFVVLGTDKKNAHRFFPKEIIKNPNFYFLPFVAYKKLPYYIALADLWFGRFAREEKSILPAFSTAGIEAMACGKPIIVSTSCEYKRFIKDGVNSIIVPFNNSKAIFEKIIYYFRNKKKLRKMGRTARKTAEKYFSRKALVEFFQQWLTGREKAIVKSVWGQRIKNMRGYSKNNLREKRVDKRLSAFVKSGDRILDVGCFYPTEAMRFAKKGCKVISIDFSPQVISKAKRVAAEKRLKNKIKFEVQDAMDLKYKDSSFDVVCDFATSVHIPRWQEAIKEYGRVLKKSGKLVIVSDNKLQPAAWRELLRQWLNKGIHPRWGYFAPHFPWQLKKELEKRGLKVERFDSEGMWRPILPRAIDKSLEGLLVSLSRRFAFVKYLGWRFGLVAVKK